LFSHRASVEAQGWKLQKLLKCALLVSNGFLQASCILHSARALSEKKLQTYRTAAPKMATGCPCEGSDDDNSEQRDLTGPTERVEEKETS